jgi:hypothetical protein
MKAMTKLFALGALGAGVFAVARARQRAAKQREVFNPFDISGLDEPIVVSEEEVVIMTEPAYEDAELLGDTDQDERQR